MRLLNSYFQQILQEQREENLLRETHNKVIKAHEISFASNDYLGFAKQTLSELTKKHPELEEVCIGSSGSRLSTGTHEIHLELEQFIAEWKNTEAAIVFGSGYLANIGLLAAMLSPRDVAYSDSLNHACILDGIRLSKSKKYIYHHRSTEHLRELISATRSRSDKAVIVTDSVFSMDGDRAKLREIVSIAQEFDAAVYLDEAHATGVLGKNGEGLVNAVYGDDRREFTGIDLIQMGTLSKAIGVEGAYIAGSQNLIDFIKNKARSFIYSTAPSPLMMKLALINIKESINQTEHRNKLWENIRYFQALLENELLDTWKFTNEDTAIFALHHKASNKLEALEQKAQSLREAGIVLNVIKPPTVEQPILRVCINASHSKEQILSLFQMINS